MGPAKPSVGQLVPQKHGGALRHGNPGSWSGGRPPSKVRELCRQKFEERIPVLTAIADNELEASAERIRAIDALGRYGVGSVREVSVDDVRTRLARMLEVIRAQLPPEDADRVIAALKPIWV